MLIRGVRDMNRSRSEQQGLTPIAQGGNIGSECRHHGGQALEGAQADEGNLESEINLRQIAYGFDDFATKFVRGSHQAVEQERMGFVRNYVGRAAAFDGADVQGAWPDLRIGQATSWRAACAELRRAYRSPIRPVPDMPNAPCGRLRVSSARSAPFEAIATLFSVGSPLIRNLQPIALFIGDFRAQAVALFAHQEQQADVNSFCAQALGGRYLRSDDAFGIARAAAVNAVLIFRGRNEGRHGIHVGGENDAWIGLLRGGGVNVGSARLRR